MIPIIFSTAIMFVFVATAVYCGQMAVLVTRALIVSHLQGKTDVPGKFWYRFWSQI